MIVCDIMDMLQPHGLRWRTFAEQATRFINSGIPLCNRGCIPSTTASAYVSSKE